MLENILKDVKLVENTIFDNLELTLGIIGLMLIINILNYMFHRIFYIFGIVPRHIMGLPGILFSPFVHGDFNHLFFNAIPLFFLMNMVLVYGLKAFIIVSLSIIILTGILVWLFGRHAIHIGASGVIMGYFGFSVIVAFLAPSFLSIMLIILCLYYFGGLVASLIPTGEDGVSVEGHIFGFISGIATYYFWPDIIKFFNLLIK
jgi:membrane associated rhomboid family serine protease